MARHTKIYARGGFSDLFSRHEITVSQSRTLPAPLASVAAPIRARSVTGTSTRVYKLDNHYAWLSVALHLATVKR